ncbi:hypothetical protein [Fibrobacter sp.]|uniref:hypothetical protein n=1 Tax=Fibrobacter sp. TaxID=35828 RepID=UPI0038643696
MFFLKQLGSLLNAVKEIDPDANPSVMIKFKTPNGSEAKAVYVHNSFDGEGDSQGSIVLYNGDDKTEFDSLQYTVDGIQGLCNSQGAQPAITEAVNSNKEKTSITAVGKLELYVGDFSTQFFAEVYSKDGWTEELAIELASEIEKQFKPGEIETEYLSPMDNMNDNRGGCTYQIVMNMNISISLSALDSRVQGAMYKFQGIPTIKYNDEGESDTNAQTNNDVERQVADNIDTAMMDHYDMMNGDIGDIFESSVKTLCGKAGKPALAEAVIKLFNVYKPVMEAEGVSEQIFANYLDKKGITEVDAVSLERILNDMVYEKRISSAEADKLWLKVMNGGQPKLEAVEANHRVIPEEIAKAVNAAQAEDYGWRPETAEREFEETWDWLEDHADTVLNAWNANNDPREVVRAIENEEERGVWAAEASMMEAVEDIPTDVKQKIADFANMYGIHLTEIDDDVRNSYYRYHESKEPPNADYGLDIGVFDDNWKLTPKGQRAIQYMKAMGFSHEVDYNKYGEPYLLFKFDAKKDPFLSAK